MATRTQWSQWSTQWDDALSQRPGSHPMNDPWHATVEDDVAAARRAAETYLGSGEVAGFVGLRLVAQSHQDAARCAWALDPLSGRELEAMRAAGAKWRDIDFALGTARRDNHRLLGEFRAATAQALDILDHDVRAHIDEFPHPIARFARLYNLRSFRLRIAGVLLRVGRVLGEEMYSAGWDRFAAARACELSPSVLYKFFPL